MRVRRIAITGAAALALVAGGTAAGATIASSPVSSSGVIDGCYTNAEVNGSHVFVLQNQGTACPKGTTAISWNQTGPQGPAGATGPAGTTGPAGPAGPAGSPGAAGTGATVASLASGNSNCPNGGAQITDGNGDVAYACNGGAPSVHSGGGNAQPLGDVSCGEEVVANGTNSGSDNWYEVVGTGSCSSLMSIQVSGTGDVFDLYQNEPVAPALGNGLTETAVEAGTYYIDVYGGTSGSFTLTVAGG
jgi:hypothetical protein